MSTPPTEHIERDERLDQLPPVSLDERERAEQVGPAHELGVWLEALRSFFQVQHHPLTTAEQASLLTRDWTSELRIARSALLRSSQLAHSLVHAESAGGDALPIEDDSSADLSLLTLGDAEANEFVSSNDLSLVALSESLFDIICVCDELLEKRAVGFHAWAGIGKILGRALDNSDAAQSIMRAAAHHTRSNLQPSLLDVAQTAQTPTALGADLLVIFTELSRLLGTLLYIEKFLRRDDPLKQTLPLFTLIHQGARSLIEFIETRAMRTEGLSETVFDALDGLNYAVGMELRKVFAHELVGLSALRHAPAIYARVENAHGLLRDSFQQSTVALAQLFDATLDGARLFNSFNNKLEQSLALRRDLWLLLQLVRRAEKERDRYPMARLLERLDAFRDGSLRYLMYKDWEACERFIEEVAAARGVVELAPVLHRFGAYLETLQGQVSMRAVLAQHPFDFPALES